MSNKKDKLIAGQRVQVAHWYHATLAGRQGTLLRVGPYCEVMLDGETADCCIPRAVLEVVK